MNTTTNSIDIPPAITLLRPGDFPEVFDSSLANEFKECPQKFYLNSIQWWKGRGRSVHLHAGGAFAHGIEASRRAFYQGITTHEKQVLPITPYDSETSVAVGVGALLEFYGDFVCPEGIAKTPERMAGALEFYFENYPLLQDQDDPIVLPGGQLGIEFGFVEPLEVCHPVTGQPILYSGRMDAILNHAGSKLLTDEKTATSLGPTWSRQWDLRAQFTGYAWGCQRNQIQVDGALIRGVSILKTKYETQAAITYRSKYHIDRWFTELNEWIEEAIKMWKRKSFRHNLGEACSSFGGCSFKTICQTEDPSQKEAFLATYFEQRHWDPVQRVEIFANPSPAPSPKESSGETSSTTSGDTGPVDLLNDSVPPSAF